jgi:hypothetical protein
MKEDFVENFYIRNIRPLDQSLIDECLDIIGNVERRKAEVVNWEERRLLNEVTKRSGHILHKGEPATKEAQTQILNETAGATSNKEKELMGGLGDILKNLEQLDEKK